MHQRSWSTRLSLAIAVAGLLPMIASIGPAAAATPASYTFAPPVIAPSASLTRLVSRPVVLTVRSASGRAVPGAIVYVSFNPVPGGGTAQTPHGPLTSTPQPIRTNPQGQIGMSYHAPSVLPPGGTDVIVAQDQPASPHLMARASYTFGSDWSKFHGDSINSGLTPDVAINATTASSLTVAWQAALGAGSSASPAATYDGAIGRTLVYVGGQAVPGQGAPFAAFDAATGAVVWKVKIRGGNLLSSPAIAGGVVYVGSGGGTLVGLDASTGATVCSIKTVGRVTASPVVGNPDGAGPVVYFGDAGFTGGPDQGNFWAVKAGTCALRWKFSAFGDPPGSVVAASYDEPGFAFDATGRPLVVFGSTDPDNAVYALDARTGALAWRFQTVITPDGDVGAGPTISPPGVNGFADGVVYITGKDEIVYALDLTTGAQLWTFDIYADSGSPQDTESVAALVGARLYLGYGAGVYALNAITGDKLWRADGIPLIYSSPAVSGPSGSQVLLIGDTGGGVHAFDLTGDQLWSMSTGGAVYSSPAIVGPRAFLTDAATGMLIALSIPKH